MVCFLFPSCLCEWGKTKCAALTLEIPAKIHTGTESGQNWGGGNCGGQMSLTFDLPTRAKARVHVHLISVLFTRPEWISFPLVHCVSLGNVVELGQAPKLLPDRVIVEEGPHGIIHIPNEALRDRKQ